jgi:signal transduction histidine kinase
MNDSLLSGSGWLRVILSLFGVVAVSWSIVAQYLQGGCALWVLVVVLVANAAWIGFIAAGQPPKWVHWTLVIIMVVAGGITAPAGDGTPIVPAAVGIMMLTRDIRVTLSRAITLGIGAMLVVLLGDAIVPVTPLGLIAMEIGLAVAFLAGQSRRQFVLADIRSHELAQEQSRSDVLGARQQIAHDIHDVLAHSLGGLVIQLDAVDALLEAGDIAAAEDKVKDARALARDGLTEARRAVAALSEPPADAAVTGAVLVAEIEKLLAAHRSLGGEVTFRETGSRRDVPEPLEVAVQRAVQEGLTNARKHAPGAPVAIELDWREEALGLEVSNPVTATTRKPTGGHGLVGMRARFASLPGGSATARAQEGRFVVHAEATIP